MSAQWSAPTVRSETNRSISSVSNSNADIIKTNETVVYSGYRTIVRKEFQLPNEKKASYDIVSQKHLSISVFIWNTTTSTTTLIKEFHPGSEKFLYGVVAGMYETSKHNSPLHASQLELEEEAHLKTDKWIPLLDTADTSMSFDKYSTNRFYSYLALDCEHVANPAPCDDEELISIEHGVSYRDMMRLVTSGQINMVSTHAILLGVQKLRDMGVKLE